MYSTLKFLHVGFAILTIAGFVLRGTWMIGRSAYLDRIIVRVLPHVVDTLFLITGIWLVIFLRLNAIEHGWLLAKLTALVLYIVLGAIALRRGRTFRIRVAAFVAALMTYLYVVGVALQKSAMSWLAIY